MKKRAVILFMASILAIGTMVGCSKADEKDLEGFKNAMSSVTAAIGDKDTVKVTSVKGITFERPSEWVEDNSEGSPYCLLPTNNVNDYQIDIILTDLGSEYKDFEWNKQTVNEVAESTKASIKESKGNKFTVTSDEEVTVCDKYARKFSSYIISDGTEYIMTTYIFGNSSYAYAYSNIYKSSLGNTYEKEFENIIKSIEFV